MVSADYATDEEESDDLGGLAVLTKADRILTALEGGGELTVKEIASATSESMNAVYRVLPSLVDLQWIERGDKRGRYRLGVGFIRLASAAETHLDVRETVRGALEQLHQATRETTYLVVRSDRSGVCIERLEGYEVLSLAMKLGDSLPLSVGAAPLALLAFMPASVSGPIIASFRLNASQSEHLSRRIELARTSGVVWSDGDVTPGIAACGAPVFNHLGHVIASISVSGRRDALMPHVTSIESEVRAAAVAASERLGWPGPWPVLTEEGE